MNKSDAKTRDKVAKLVEEQDFEGFKNLVEGLTMSNKSFDGSSILGYLTQLIGDDQALGEERPFLSSLSKKGPE